MSAQTAASYYSDLTSQYRHYGGDAHGWHYGIWEGDVQNHEDALTRSNEYLLRGLSPTPSIRILDVGFGGGGFSTWAAANYGAHVTGITICPGHVEVANDLAAEKGVAANCRFLEMDMDDLKFDADQFDIVINQETACYAKDKESYAAKVYRVLKPGGIWRYLDFSIQPDELSAAEEPKYRDVCEGFHIPSLISVPDLNELLLATGYQVDACDDITAKVLRTAVMIRRQCLIPLAARYLGLDWLVYSRAEEQRSNRRGHILAAFQFSRGLESGLFRYAYCSARKPHPSEKGDV